MKKGKEEILRNKEQSIIQSTEQPSAQSNGELMSIALVCLRSLPSVFVYFLHLTLLRLKIKKQANEKKHQPPKRRHML